MKRILIFALTLCLLVSMMTMGASAKYSDTGTKITQDGAGNNDHAGTAAQSGDGTGTVIGEQNIPVKVVTNSSGGTVHVYAVTISATELTFTWNNTASTIWNPETLKYETGSAGSWAQATQTLTINNYSDVGITVTPDNPAPTSSDQNISVTVGDAVDIKSAFDGGTDASVKSGTIDVTVEITGGDQPDGTYVTAQPIANFNLKITRNDDI